MGRDGRGEGGCGGTGRRAGLRIPWGNPYRFKSCRPHCSLIGVWSERMSGAGFADRPSLREPPAIVPGLAGGRIGKIFFPTLRNRPRTPCEIEVLAVILQGALPGSEALPPHPNQNLQKRPRRTSRAGWACRALATGFFIFAGFRRVCEEASADLRGVIVHWARPPCQPRRYPVRAHEALRHNASRRHFVSEV